MLGSPPSTLQLQHLCLNSPRGRGVCPAEVATGQDALPLCSQGNHSGEHLPIPSPLHCSGGTFGCPTGLLMAANEAAGSLAGTSAGVSTSVGSLLGAANSGGSLVGLTGSLWGWLPGFVPPWTPKVWHPPGWPCQRRPHRIPSPP